MAEISSITREFVLKTDGITYWEVVTVTYDDESQDITKRPVGTAAQLAADQADKIVGRTREIVTQAQRIGVNGGANKTARVFGDAIRLNNYPSAPADTDFYLSENGGRYFSLPNRNVVIKTP